MQSKDFNYCLTLINIRGLSFIERSYKRSLRQLFLYTTSWVFFVEVFVLFKTDIFGEASRQRSCSFNFHLKKWGKINIYYTRIFN